MGKSKKQGKIKYGRRLKAGLQRWFQERRLRPLQESAWKNLLGSGPGEKLGPGELVDFQGSPSPWSRMIHPNKQEIKQSWHEQIWCRDTRVIQELEHLPYEEGLTELGMFNLKKNRCKGILSR